MTFLFFSSLNLNKVANTYKMEAKREEGPEFYFVMPKKEYKHFSPEERAAHALTKLINYFMRRRTPMKSSVSRMTDLLSKFEVYDGYKMVFDDMGKLSSLHFMLGTYSSVPDARQGARAEPAIYMNNNVGRFIDPVLGEQEVRGSGTGPVVSETLKGLIRVLMKYRDTKHSKLLESTLKSDGTLSPSGYELCIRPNWCTVTFLREDVDPLDPVSFFRLEDSVFSESVVEVLADEMMSVTKTSSPSNHKTERAKRQELSTQIKKQLGMT